jgi:predicted metal-dependent peptidase
MRAQPKPQDMTVEQIDAFATERIKRARIDLIRSHAFYGVLVGQVKPVLSRKFPTMATNGKVHYFNPDFIAKLTMNKTIGVQRHESEHDARRHHTRRGGRDPVEWNISTDYAINIDLIDEGVELPDGALVDARYRGWSAEDIYRARQLDKLAEQKKQQEQPKPEEGDGEPDEGQDEPQDGDQGEGDDAQEQDADDQGEGTQDGEDEGDEGQGRESDAPADGEGGDEGDEAGAGGHGGDADEAADADEAGGAGQGGDAQEGDAGEGGNGSGDADGDQQPGQGQGEGTQDGADADDQGQEGRGKGGQTSSGDPGVCGEVLDAADDAADLSVADAQWETILRQAHSLAKGRGDLPGHVTREIKRADTPPQDWREVLRAWIDTGSKTIETWSRPNRRFAGGGLYLPGRARDGLNRVAFLVDTSGSMDAIALACIKVETQAALDDGAIDEVIVVYGDTRVTRVDEYRQGDEIVFDPRGGGGTDLKPLFKYVEDEVDNPSLIVCFSDMEIGDPGPEPSCPVLFAATGYPDRVREYLANAPWGAPGIDVGAH